RLFDYDGASRLLRARGPVFANAAGGNAVFNEAFFTYDQASHLLSTTTIDRSPVKAEESFTSHRLYDALGRLVRSIDPVGNTTRLTYDSRSNVIAASDAKSRVLASDPYGQYLGGPINGHGNVVQFFYDGISRPVLAVRLLQRGGEGDGSLHLFGERSNLDTSNPANPDGMIVTRQSWDRNSRLIARTDDNGNRTSYVYDQRDRRVVTRSADRFASQTVYDEDSLPVAHFDRNGTVLRSRFDGIGRVLTREVSRLAQNLAGTVQKVEGTTLQAFEYDGLSRLRRSLDNNDAADGGDDVLCEYGYDSLSRTLVERHLFRARGVVQPTTTTTGKVGFSTTAATIDRSVVGRWDLDSNRIALTYPTSGRTLGFQRDGLDRMQVVGDLVGPGVLDPIQTSEFVGGYRPVRQTARNGVTTSYAYDKKRRVTGIDHVASGGARVAGFAYRWDRSDHRVLEEHLPQAPLPRGRIEAYGYDSAYRVTKVSFGDGRPDTSYRIDGVGNWAQRSEDGRTQTFNDTATGRYSFDPTNEYFERSLFDGAGRLVGKETATHDDNGNRIQDARFRLFYDAFDRLVRVERASDGVTVGRYRYDAAGRRVHKWFRDPATGAADELFFVCDGAREIEELDVNGALRADFVWGGLYVDELVQLRRERGAGTGLEVFYAHQDSIYSLAALSDASGAVRERYDYTSIYGTHQVRDGAGGARAPPDEIGNPWRFQGRRYDPETGFYCFRQRYLDPALGRFVSRDPLGMWGDPGNLGNGYAFAGNDPVNRVDP
ncbi:MAG: hypothetical protein D6683_13575, partial [Actinomyces sp.]